MRRIHRIVLLAGLVALAPVLAGCENFDMDKLDVFGLNEKKKLPGDRKPVFPEGVPGVSQGIPPEYIKGNQPPPDSAQAAPALPAEPDNKTTAAEPAKKTAAVEPVAEPKPKPKRKPKPRVTVSAPAQPAPQSQSGAQAQPPAWPGQQQDQQQPPQQAQSPWPGSAPAPAPGTFSR